MITEVKDVKGGMPNIFSLQQNYPNPFLEFRIVTISFWTFALTSDFPDPKH